MKHRADRGCRILAENPVVAPPAKPSRHMRGPTEKARTSDPIPADPFHHQALRPSVNPSDVAPTVELAPMLAARNVEKIRPAPSRRPPQRNRWRARRPAHSPIETKTAEMRKEEREVNYFRSRAAG